LANIACGGHAGDPTVSIKRFRWLANNAVLIGGSPSYPDLQGFGRRKYAVFHPGTNTDYSSSNRDLGWALQNAQARA